MNLDFSPLKELMDHLALQIAIYGIVVILLSFLLVFALKLIKLPRIIAQPVAVFGGLYLAYKVFLVMFN